ncbi:beta-ketoacyl synthase N-terminal-like domain-containing protein [Streptomyces endocoffeicus]|uniref:beta-ketoacyl synthase N-terminal-like domain-containing protein n=1 Tax=Streptomyces endocoffeicus TaxID=2898945 RepID=UPI0027DB7BD3|nr:beta-ketoacyl synthase N-terminal-like domain-containing protein [Streptomyces endocoffeicus]
MPTSTSNQERNEHPREAEVRDPQHRLFPESVHTALEDAGYDPFSVPGRVGVFAGSAPNAYEPQNVSHHQERVQALGQMTVSIGNTNDYVAPTVSYKLGLTGPSVNVATACSSSLVAVHMACRSLMNGECETAVAGGVEVEPPVVSGYWSAEGGIYSGLGRQQRRCRPGRFHGTLDQRPARADGATPTPSPLSRSCRRRRPVAAPVRGNCSLCLHGPMPLWTPPRRTWRRPSQRA